MEREYSKENKQAKQVITTHIQAAPEKVFHYLATTEGIALWFPQLSIEEEQVLFDLGDGAFQKMALLDYKTNEHIAYEWATGAIHFHLEEKQNETKLTLTETLPENFQALPEDFTGWFVQMKNIQSVSENGQPAQLTKDELQAVRAEVNDFFQ